MGIDRGGVIRTLDLSVPNRAHYVAPARRAVLADSLPVTSHTLERETFALRFDLLPGEVATGRATAYTPTETYLGLEVFNLERVKVEWLQERDFDLTRRAEHPSVRFGREYQLAVDTGTQRTIPVRFLLNGRAAISIFYGWLNARIGRTVPLWVSTGENDLDMTASSGNSMTLSGTTYTKNYNLHSARKHLRVVQTSGAIVKTKITAAVNNGNGTETLTNTVATGFPVTSISFLRYCRLSTDSIEIAHRHNGSDMISECTLSFIELLTAPTVAVVTEFITGVTAGGLRSDYAGHVGFEMTAARAETVTHLGRYMLSGNTASHTLSLVNQATGVVLASVVVAMTGGTVGTFVYGALGSPVTLAIGAVYAVLSSETVGGDQWYDTTPVTSTGVAVINGSAYIAALPGIAAIASAGVKSFVPVSFKY